MANFVFVKAKTKLLNKEIDLSSGGDDIRALIVMTDTIIDTSEDIEFLSALSGVQLDEYDGSGYARAVLTGETVLEDTSLNLTRFTSDPATFNNIGVGTRLGQAIVIYKHVGADSANIPLFYHEPTAFPFNGNGAPVIVTPHANGWFRW